MIINRGVIVEREENYTLNYYDANAEEYFESSKNVNMEGLYSMFEKYLDPTSKILDFGCGSGRDSKYFLNKGYVVEAIDGSKELCELASNYLEIEVKHILFEEFDSEDKYDGIWACASLLHLSSEDLNNVFSRLLQALKENGVIYASFKYGDFEGERGNRYYNDFNEKHLEEFLSQYENCKVLENWISDSAIPGREERWLNVIVQKI